MENDDNLPLRNRDPLSIALRQDIDPLSVSELHERIALLQLEIGRCQAKIDHASSHRNIADRLFNKG